MNIEFLYPEAKRKALTFSYDDGQVHDERLVEIFNKHKIKATFHLNSGTLDREGYVKSQQLKALYKGHEVACHGKNHKYLTKLTKEQLINEIWEDRKALEGYMDQMIVGMSYAYGDYSSEVKQILNSLGISYARTVSATDDFDVPKDLMSWHPTCHHNANIIDKADLFLNTPPYKSLSLFYIWGHSYEFERDNNWGLIESFCEKISCQEDIWYATNLEIERYISAIHHMTVSTDERMYLNHSNMSIWIQCEGETIELKPGVTKL